MQPHVGGGAARDELQRAREGRAQPSGVDGSPWTIVAAHRRPPGWCGRPRPRRRARRAAQRERRGALVAVAEHAGARSRPRSSRPRPASASNAGRLAAARASRGTGRTGGRCRRGRPGARTAAIASAATSPGGIASCRKTPIRSPAVVRISWPTITVEAGRLARRRLACASSAPSIRSWSVIARCVRPRAAAARTTAAGRRERVEARRGVAVEVDEGSARLAARADGARPLASRPPRCSGRATS